MIGYLKGKVLSKEKPNLILLCGVVGYEVGTPNFLFDQVEVGETVELYIHTHVKEDEISLYGMPGQTGIKCFKKMLSISGVGPKLALTILSSFTLPELVEIVRQRDVVRFKTVPGIGAKKAEKLLLELQSKLKIEDMTVLPQRLSLTKLPMELDLQNALIQLGYKQAEFQPALDQLKDQLGDTMKGCTLSELLSMVLQNLSHAHFGEGLS